MMLPDVQNLIELQLADREVLRLKEEIAALPKRVAAIEEKLAGTKAILENAKIAVKADEANRRKYETAIKDVQQKISKYRDQSLEVKTNEQYRALMHEIQFAEQDIRANEDKILELMVTAEAREKSVKAAELELKAEMAEIEKEKAEARERTAEDEKQLAEWNAKREKARAGVDPDLLRHYDRVSKFRGSGLSEVRDQQCLTCRVMLRPQTYNDVRSGQMVICESCQRVLYYNPANEIAPERPSLTAKRRARPKIHIDKAWFYRPDFEGIGEAFLAFVNAQGSSSRRVYDAHTGRKVGDTEFQSGEFTTAFADDIRGAIRLKGGLEEEQLDEWAEELPMVILDELNADLKVARAEKSHVASETSQHPAAS
jgi:uncharacterized protein